LAGAAAALRLTAGVPLFAVILDPILDCRVDERPSFGSVVAAPRIQLELIFFVVQQFDGPRSLGRSNNSPATLRYRLIFCRPTKSSIAAFLKATAHFDAL
jgi:hypothetical protein